MDFAKLILRRRDRRSRSTIRRFMLSETENNEIPSYPIIEINDQERVDQSKNDEVRDEEGLIIDPEMDNITEKYDNDNTDVQMIFDDEVDKRHLILSILSSFAIDENMSNKALERLLKIIKIIFNTNIKNFDISLSDVMKKEKTWLSGYNITNTYYCCKCEKEILNQLKDCCCGSKKDSREILNFTANGTSRGYNVFDITVFSILLDCLISIYAGESPDKATLKNYLLERIRDGLNDLFKNTRAKAKRKNAEPIQIQPKLAKSQLSQSDGHTSNPDTSQVESEASISNLSSNESTLFDD